MVVTKPRSQVAIAFIFIGLRPLLESRLVVVPFLVEFRISEVRFYYLLTSHYKVRLKYYYKKPINQVPQKMLILPKNTKLKSIWRGPTVILP